ncbi:MAG: serine hydrolase [Chitinophagales bacterium]
MQLNKVFNFLLGLLVISLSNPVAFSQTQTNKSFTEIRKPKQDLIHPLLDCADFSSSTIREIQNLEDSLKSYILQKKSKKEVKEVSIYYRTLNNGPWVGINADKKYCPASLLKVPFLIAAFKQQEYDSSFLNKMVEYYPVDGAYIKNIDNNQYMQFGNKYSIYQLLQEMIINSDNNAMEIAVNNIWNDVFESVFYDLNIDYNAYGPEDRFISPKQYAAYFRILYNATYLNPYMSNLALEILTQAKYQDGIIAGLPKDVVVAHKYGERSFINSKELELHDCAIVYDDEQPYILCVMTRGYNFENQTKIISEISNMIYTANQISKL